MEPLFSPDELERIRAYAAPQYAWVAVRDFVHLSVYGLLLAFAIQPLFRAAQSVASGMERRLGFLRSAPGFRLLLAALDRMWQERGWGTAILFGTFSVLLIRLVYLPRDLYFYYFHEHRFGLSNYTPATFALHSLKDLALTALLTALLAFGLYGLARRTQRWWLALGIVAGFGLLFSSALDPYRARLYFEQQSLPEGPLRARLIGLLSSAGVEFQDIKVEQSSTVSRKVQAYFAGQGKTRAIVLNDVLLDQFSDEEIVAAVAHEAAHSLENHWARRVLASLTLIAFLYLIHRLLRVAFDRRWFGATRFADIRTLPLVSLFLYVFLTLFQPISGAYSRQQELAADAFALRLTDDPATFRRMLIKAAKLNMMDPDPPRWVEWRALTHPSLRTRLEQVSLVEASRRP